MSKYFKPSTSIRYVCKFNEIKLFIIKRATEFPTKQSQIINGTNFDPKTFH